jgi:SAM-dependent methyltransferase
VQYSPRVGPGVADAVMVARRDFPIVRLDGISRASSDHFWHTPRRRLILDLLQRQRVGRESVVLDAGCGDGSLVETLVAAGVEAYGLDPWTSAIGLDPPRFRCGALSQLPWADASFDIVCALDVLEHVDDRAALAEIRRVLIPRASLIVTVPGHPWLWSRRDDEAGHRRRYTRRSLRGTLESSGFDVVRLFGFEALLLPVAAMSRLIGRQRESDPSAVEDHLPAWLNGPLLMVNLIEVRLGALVRPPTGTSLVAVARRRP